MFGYDSYIVQKGSVYSKNLRKSPKEQKQNAFKLVGEKSERDFKNQSEKEKKMGKRGKEKYDKEKLLNR